MTKQHSSRVVGRIFGFGVAVGVAAAMFAASGACASNGAMPVDDGIETKNETCEGCPCTDGDVGECHKTLDSRPGYLLCEVGKTTCQDGKWGACEGTRTVIQGAGVSYSKGVRTLALATDAGACTNPCSPSCQNFVDDGVNLDAGSTGLTLTEGGGVTLLGEAGIGCLGLSCQVNRACPGGAKTTLTGVVKDPGGGNVIPNVYVYVPNGTPDPYSVGVASDVCGGGGSLTGDPLPFPVQTNYKGEFTLQDVPTGTNIPVVLQIGRWRRQITIPSVTACVTQSIGNIDGLGNGVTRLARRQNEGSPYDNIPQIAVVAGSADNLSYFIKRIGVDASEFTTHNGTGRVHFFRTPSGGTLQGSSAATYDVLVGSPAQLAKYDMVFLSCDGGNEWYQGGVDPFPLRNVAGTTVTHSQAHNNLRGYAAVGGRIFATHYGREWIHQGPNPAFPGVAGWWTPDTSGSAPSLNAVTTFPKGVQFRDWMVYTGHTFPFTPVTYRTDIIAKIDPTVAWLTGFTTRGGNSTVLDSNITFNTPLGLPDGAAPPGGYRGKVTYSDIHITIGGGVFPTSTPAGALNNDESALEFLVFDLSSCVSTYTGPVTFPGPATYTRVYEANCPVGKKVRWRQFNWRGVTPGTSSIAFKVGTAQTTAELGAATFTSITPAPWQSMTPVVAPFWASADVTPALQSIDTPSRQFLAVKITLNPSLDGQNSPTLYQWMQDFECLEDQ